MAENAVRFGVYDLDLRTGELRKQGLRLQLRDQSFQVLAALLERPGELVTRQDLIRRLWPDGTVVNFDRSLNSAVTRLRQALSDSAGIPRYIETVNRKGYRFIGRAEFVPQPRPASRPVAAARRWRVAAAAAVVLLALAAGAAAEWVAIRTTAHARSGGVRSVGTLH